jgi:hypothetical protein
VTLPFSTGVLTDKTATVTRKLSVSLCVFVRRFTIVFHNEEFVETLSGIQYATNAELYFGVLMFTSNTPKQK